MSYKYFLYIMRYDSCQTILVGPGIEEFNLIFKIIVVCVGVRKLPLLQISIKCGIQLPFAESVGTEEWKSGCLPDFQEQSCIVLEVH